MEWRGMLVMGWRPGSRTRNVNYFSLLRCCQTAEYFPVHFPSYFQHQQLFWFSVADLVHTTFLFTITLNPIVLSDFIGNGGGFLTIIKLAWTRRTEWPSSMLYIFANSCMQIQVNTSRITSHFTIPTHQVHIHAQIFQRNEASTTCQQWSR